MSIDYEAYELLNIFENEPYTPQEGSGIFSYKTLSDKNGFIFLLDFSDYENIGNITLRHSGCVDDIFSIDLENLTAIKANDEKMDLFSIDKSNPFITVYFKPGYSLKFGKKLS